MGFTQTTISFILLMGSITQLSLSPDTWFKKPEEATPEYQQIQFWDFEEEEYRGIRAIFYALMSDVQNRRVDQRLHSKMLQFLSYMCQDVITAQAIDTQYQKQLNELSVYEKPANPLDIDNVFQNLVDEWKLSNSISPDELFTSLSYPNEEPLVVADVVVLMERTHYDHLWKDDKKYLVIGINIAAFELDFGQPLFADRMMLEVPWFGESTSYSKAEHTALLEVANAVGEAFKKAADMINQIHEDEVEAAKRRELELQQETLQRLKDETDQFKQLVQVADSVLETYSEPNELKMAISDDLESLREMLKISPTKLTPEEAEVRKTLAANIHDHLQQLQEWLVEQERKKKEQELSQPPANAPEPVISNRPTSTQQLNIPSNQKRRDWSIIPNVDVPTTNIFDRRWLIPDDDDTEPIKSIQQPSSTLPTPDNDLIPEPISAPPQIQIATPFTIPQLTLPDKPYHPFPTPKRNLNLPPWFEKNVSSKLPKKGRQDNS